MNSYEVSNSLIGIMLPFDLVEYIWSLNYNWAIDIISKYNKKYMNSKIYKLNTIYNIYHQMKYGFNESLFRKKNISFDNMVNQYQIFKNILNKENIIQILNLCKCCERHKFNKILNHNCYKNFKFIEFIGENNKLKCKCPCRHIRRNILKI